MVLLFLLTRLGGIPTLYGCVPYIYDVTLHLRKIVIVQGGRIHAE